MPVDANRLAAAVASAPLLRVGEAVYFRSVDFGVVRKLRIDVLDGTHAGRTGGRYNEPGSAPTTYLAASQTLASLECEQDRLELAIPARPTPPRLLVGVTVSGLHVLDLTNEAVLTHLAVTSADLTIPSQRWRTLNAANQLSTCQRIGAAARSRSDCDGVLAPSWFRSQLGHVLPRMENLVLFMDLVASSRPRNPSVKASLFDPDGLLSHAPSGPHN